MDYFGDDDPVVPKAVKTPLSIDVTSPGPAGEEDVMEEIKESVFTKTAGKKDTLRFYVCIPRAEQLDVEHNRFSGLYREFTRRGTLA